MTMFSVNELLLFSLAALVLVLTPGPNMIYCVSRSLTQGPRAGLTSLAGVVLAFVVHLLAASLGLTALLLAVPMAFDAIRIAGALYLLWMAWQAVKPGVNALLVLGAGGVSRFMNRSPRWIAVQRWFMGTVLAALALRLLTEKRPA